MNDFAFQAPERERFEKIFTNHKIVLLKDSGHFIQEDTPYKITDAIKAWCPFRLPKQLSLLFRQFIINEFIGMVYEFF